MDQIPTFETRAEQPYVGKRVIMPLQDFGKTVPALLREISKWMTENGVKASGKPFLRYHVIDMPRRMDVEIAFPVDELPKVKGAISRGTLPSGRYATLTYNGVEDGLIANAKLVKWLEGEGEKMDCELAKNGEAFTGRIEVLLIDPAAEPNHRKKEVAIKLRDGRALP